MDAFCFAFLEDGKLHLYIGSESGPKLRIDSILPPLRIPEGKAKPSHRDQ